MYNTIRRSYAMKASMDHATWSYDHQHVTEEHYANMPVIAFCNIDYPRPEKLSRMLKKKKMKEKRLTHNSNNSRYSCGLAKKQRLQGKKKGDATTGSSTIVLSPAAP